MMGGIRLPRNSRQQAQIGIDVDFTDLSNIQRGDLIFSPTRRLETSTM